MLSTSSLSDGDMHFAGCPLGHIICHNGIPLFSEEGQAWVFSRTGEGTAFQKLKAFDKRQQVQPPSLSLSYLHGSLEQLYKLPDRSIVEQGIYWFQNSAFRLVFPAIDTVLFRDTVAVAYEPCEGRLSLERICAKGCVLAFLAIMCIFNGDSTWRPIVDSDECAVKAHYLLSDMVQNANIVTLQTVFMLAIFRLGGHMQTNIKPFGAEVSRREREVRHLRTIFWLCYIFDQDTALRTGQPPIMCEEHCDLTLPDRYLENCFCRPTLSDGILSLSFADESLFPYLPGDLRLGQLKGKTFRLLYSAQALRKTDTELLHDIRELDSEIENWRLSIPLKFRPALSVSRHPQFTPEIKLPQSMQHIALHLEYHHLVATIHQASGRCCPASPGASFPEGDRSGAIDSSLALALEASRSTLYYLEAAIDGLAGEAFWIIVFYPTAAMMALFFNILQDPQDMQATLDLELLRSAADLFRRMPIRRLTEYEVEHFKMVDDFIAELIRLGNCAISKAKDEEEGESETWVPREHELEI
ncbi:transcriptional activator Mut3p [Fusarium beomiforme]|uniref:Transcriptional activator Mut3p n=1 Tax=Fusarium beomiforme TaxID=44412 RepID=A0A9P5E1M9_9HYPO|nr:transcriptional activator Mut3p [Fusarium beomiforme]